MFIIKIKKNTPINLPNFNGGSFPRKSMCKFNSLTSVQLLCPDQ